MTEQHWAALAISDIYAALPEKKFWVARQHLDDARHAICAVHEEAAQAKTLAKRDGASV